MKPLMENKASLIQLNIGMERWSWLSQGITEPSTLWFAKGSFMQVTGAYFDFSWKGFVDIDGKSDLWFRCCFHMDNLSILLSTLRG